MASWIICDIILIAILAISIVYGISKGFVRAVYQIFSFVISVVLVLLLVTPFTNKLMDSSIANAINGYVYNGIYKVTDNEFGVSTISEGIENTGIPKFMQEAVFENLDMKIQNTILSNEVSDVVHSAADVVTRYIVQVIAAVILFIIIRIALSIIIRILDAVLSLPLLNLANRFLGALVGCLNGMIIVYAICGAIMLLVPIMDLSKVTSIIDKTFITYWFYEKNMLMNIFMLK